MFSRGVEAAIREAIERGEFDGLPGAGKPVDLGAYFETPEELRLAYSMLKNAGLLPSEVELLRQINALEQEARLATSDDERQAATRRRRDLKLRLGVLLDVMKRKRQPR